MTEVNGIAEQLALLDEEKDKMLSEARVRRSDLLEELATLCRYLGSMTRDQLPEGILKRARGKAAKVTKPRAKKAKPAPEQAEFAKEE